MESITVGNGQLVATVSTVEDNRFLLSTDARTWEEIVVPKWWSTPRIIFGGDRFYPTATAPVWPSRATASSGRTTVSP
jgi:hypothetical protein